MNWVDKIDWIDKNLIKEGNSKIENYSKLKDDFNLETRSYTISVNCDLYYIDAVIKDRYGLLPSISNTNTFILKNIYTGNRNNYYSFIEKADHDLSSFKPYTYIEYMMGKKEVYFMAFEIYPEMYSYARDKSFFLIINTHRTAFPLKINIVNKTVWALDYDEEVI